mmetsp:Transcript_25/g.40  ORF Transcript_25/g.40 Transcript_25/m.40 type:complete len:312 (+) Transcript_25:159-1094(+)
MTTRDSPTYTRATIPDFFLQCGRFTTDISVNFLERTKVPLGLLRVCAEHLDAQQRQRRHEHRKDHDVGLLVSKKQLSIFCQRGKYPSREALLFQIQREICETERYETAAKMLVDWLGPDHWEASLDTFLAQQQEENEECGILAVCPNPRCRMTIQRGGGGCFWMTCICGREFYWNDAKLEYVVLKEACFRRIDIDRRISRELAFCRRAMELAEQITRSHEKKKSNRGRRKLPEFEKEECMDIIDEIRCLRHDRRFLDPVDLDGSPSEGEEEHWRSQSLLSSLVNTINISSDESSAARSNAAVEDGPPPVLS